MLTPWQAHAPRQRLLAQYCETLGTMHLRAQKEMALRSARIEAELASRSKSEFLANMSHELRTPLNAIIGFSDLIQHLGLEGAAKNAEYAANIADAGRHLLHVISDILDISKIESGTATLSLALHHIRDIIDSTVKLIHDRIEERHQQLEVRIAPDIPVLLVDDRRLKQILLNILSNANKFTPEEGSIAIEAEGAVEGGIRISVADSGPGMTAQELQIALKPFGQVRPDALRAHSGTGLGLPIAVALARLHGGELVLHSRPGEGTRAILSLPAAAHARKAAPDSDSVQVSLPEKARAIP